MKLEQGEYRVVSCDSNGCWLAEAIEQTRKDAKRIARAFLADHELIESGMTRVELHNHLGECLDDWFLVIPVDSTED
jgi:hypothetical protein